MNDDEKIEPITVTVTFLEMKAPPAGYSHPPLNRHVAILRTRGMPLHFYRYLMDRVGRKWHWVNVLRMRRDGVPVVSFTWYSLVDQVDWDIQLAEKRGRINACGLFDMERRPRPVAAAYRSLIEEFAGITALAVSRETLPPTINLENPDPECDLDYVANASRHAAVNYALSNSFGFGGTNAALLFKRYEK